MTITRDERGEGGSTCHVFGQINPCNWEREPKKEKREEKKGVTTIGSQRK